MVSQKTGETDCEGTMVTVETLSQIVWDCSEARVSFHFFQIFAANYCNSCCALIRKTVFKQKVPCFLAQKSRSLVKAKISQDNVKKKAWENFLNKAPWRSLICIYFLKIWDKCIHVYEELIHPSLVVVAEVQCDFARRPKYFAKLWQLLCSFKAGECLELLDSQSLLLSAAVYIWLDTSSLTVMLYNFQFLTSLVELTSMVFNQYHGYIRLF